METEMIDKLYLELSQVATAKTRRELELERDNKELSDLLRSARCICQRKGENTAWETFDQSIAKMGIGSVTARVYKVPMDDQDGDA